VEVAAQPEAVVFDLGNVLIEWDPHRAIAAAVGTDEATRFLRSFDFDAWNHQLDAGRPVQDAEADAVRSHPEWREHILAYRANFPASLTGQLDESVAVLRDVVATGVPVHALTNWPAELFPVALARFDFLGLFDQIVVSGEVRVAKPDPHIFEVLAERTGITLHRSVLIDDKPQNVEAARRAGMDGIRFVDAPALRQDLAARRLLPS